MPVYESSRYIQTRAYVRLGQENYTLPIRERATFNQDKCQLYEWCIGDTLDGVAFRFYKNTALRWAILDANPNYRTEMDIKRGDTILIPNYNEVVELINVE